MKILDPEKHHPSLPNNFYINSRVRINVYSIALHLPCQLNWKKKKNYILEPSFPSPFILLLSTEKCDSIFPQVHNLWRFADVLLCPLPKLTLIATGGLLVWGIHDQTCSVTRNKLQILKELSWCRESASVCSIYYYLLL